VNAASFEVGKEKGVTLIKRIKLTQEFEEIHILLKVGPSGQEKLGLIKSQSYKSNSVLRHY